jgi:hypothetical protein
VTRARGQLLVDAKLFEGGLYRFQFGTSSF